MFDFLKSEKDILPVAVEQNEALIMPSITDPKQLQKKREELLKLISAASADGYISQIEYQQMADLMQQVGVNNTQLAEMIREEYKKQLKQKVQLFADDGEVDKNEMKTLLTRASEIGMTREELNLCINEALSNYKEARRKKIMAGVIAAGATVIAVGGAATAVLLHADLKINFSTILHGKM